MVAKAMSKSELAALYSITAETLLQWIVDANVFNDDELKRYKKCKVITPSLVKKVYESRIGSPEI